MIYFDDGSILTEIANWFATGSIVALLTFIISYASFFRWYATGAGRSIMGFAASMGLVMLLSFLQRWLGDFEGREILRLVVMSVSFITPVFLNIELVRSWRKADLNHPTTPPPTR